VESVEASGKSIEDAILQALARLGRNRDEVDIQVLQEPSRGNRGMGAREARVRVFVRQQRASQPPARGGAPAGDAQPEFEDMYLDDEVAVAGDEAYGAEPGYGAPYPPYPAPAALPIEVAPELLTTPLGVVLPEEASIEEMAVAALQTLLTLMGMPAEIEVAEPLDPEAEEEEPLTLNIRTGNDRQLSLLIGRRGETLSALQLLVNLIVAKQSGHHERITVDAEGYRARREDNLRAMAQRIAAQVRRSGSPIMLEAMPPNERRIIHMTLAESPDVSTQSTGEGEQRRVVVSPRTQMRGGRSAPPAKTPSQASQEVMGEDR
jgi:spoIIIJ-associated protein